MLLNKKNSNDFNFFKNNLSNYLFGDNFCVDGKTNKNCYDDTITGDETHLNKLIQHYIFSQKNELDKKLSIKINKKIDKKIDNLNKTISIKMEDLERHKVCIDRLYFEIINENKKIIKKHNNMNVVLKNTFQMQKEEFINMFKENNLNIVEKIKSKIDNCETMKVVKGTQRNISKGNYILNNYGTINLIKITPSIPNILLNDNIFLHQKLREAQEISNNPQYNNYTFKYLTLETTEGPSIEEINSMGNNNQYVSPTTMDLDENIKDIIVTDIDVKEYVENKFYKKEKKKKT